MARIRNLALVRFPETEIFAARNEVVYFPSVAAFNDRNRAPVPVKHIYDPGGFGETPMTLSTGTTSLFQSKSFYAMSAADGAEDANSKELFTLDATNGLEWFISLRSDLFLGGGNIG